MRPVLGGTIREFAYGTTDGAFRDRDIYERVPIAAGSAFKQFAQLLPGRVSVLWLSLLNFTAVAVAGNGGTNGTAGAIAIVASTASTLSTGTTLSTNNIIGWAGGTASNSNAGARPVNYVQNTATSPVYLYAVPAASGAAQVFNIATDTTGYKFVGTATDTNSYQLDVSLQFKQYAPLTV